MDERLVGEIAFDAEHANKYLGVREEKSPDGRSFGVLMFSGSDGSEVLSAIHAAQKIYGGLYHFFEPLVEGSERKGMLIGGNE